jgi:hypothetical protein
MLRVNLSDSWGRDSQPALPERTGPNKIQARFRSHPGILLGREVAGKGGISALCGWDNCQHTRVEKGLTNVLQKILKF